MDGMGLFDFLKFDKTFMLQSLLQVVLEWVWGA